MRPEEIKNEINRMNLSQKLNLVQDIWNSIAESSSNIPVPEWQKSELDRRYKEYSDGKLGLYDWKTVHSDLRERHK